MKKILTLTIVIILALVLLVGCNDVNCPCVDSGNYTSGITEGDFIGTWQSIWVESSLVDSEFHPNDAYDLIINDNRTFEISSSRPFTADATASGVWAGVETRDNFGLILFVTASEQWTFQAYLTLTKLDDGTLIAAFGVTPGAWGSGGRSIRFERVEST